MAETEESRETTEDAGSGHEYDDAFRTMCIDCGYLLIPVINEIFGEHYLLDEKMEFYANEKFIERPNGKTDKRITDSDFKVGGKRYHLEAESSEHDRSMLIRMFEYDTQISLLDAEITGNELHVKFPRSAVIHLKSNSRTPDEMMIVIETPDSESRYAVPVIKVKDYSIEDIFEKELYMFIPYYIFRHVRKFKKYDEDEKSAGICKLKREYKEIFDRLEEVRDSGRIDCLTYDCILSMSIKVLEKASEKYRNVQEGVKSVMGGRVLDYPGRKEYYEGVEQGDEIRIRKTLDRMTKVKGLSFEEACDYLGINPDDYRYMESA